MHPRLSLKNITKRYPGIVANDGINMDIAPGEVLAVLGENGAGKSTLMKIIYGSVRPDEGSLEFDGRPLDVSSPAEARASGIAMVHQHFALFDTLTVAYIVADHKIIAVEYEVTYTDRTEVEFRSDGQWESVGRKYSPVPASIVPQPIQTFVSGSNYPGQFIRQIDRNAYTWEVELSNGLEIKFDNQFNVIDIDD